MVTAVLVGHGHAYFHDIVVVEGVEVASLGRIRSRTIPQ